MRARSRPTLSWIRNHDSRWPRIRAGFRRPPRRRERVVASHAIHSGVHFRFRPRLECVEDRTLLSTFLVNTTADSGAGSLRQAILDSTASTFGTSTIDFAIPGQGVQTIAPASRRCRRLRIPC